MKNSDERLEALEIKVSYLEHNLEQLDRMVIKQRKTIEELTDQLTQMRVGDTRNEQEIRGIEPPPHY